MYYIDQFMCYFVFFAKKRFYGLPDRHFVPALPILATCSRITYIVERSVENTEFSPCASCAGSPV